MTLRTYELLRVSAGPFPLLSNDRTRCLLRITVREQDAIETEYVVEVTLRDRSLGRVCLPTTTTGRDLGQLHRDPAGRAWLASLELGKHPGVDAARELARQGKPS